MNGQNIHKQRSMLKKGESGRRLTVIGLERALRQGATPDSIGAEEIGRGAQNTAYSYTTSKGASYVIKTLVGGYIKGGNRPPKWIKQFGFKFARTSRAGKWIIQERCETLVSELDYNHPVKREHTRMCEVWPRQRERGGHFHDIHGNNCGINFNGTPVVFDW